MSDVGKKLAEAVDAGEFFCGICGRMVDMDGARDFDEASQRVLSHTASHANRGDDDE